MKFRLTGTRDECARLVGQLAEAPQLGLIREVSQWYPNRGSSGLGRVYLDLELPSPADNHSQDAADQAADDQAADDQASDDQASDDQGEAAPRRGRRWSR